MRFRIGMVADAASAQRLLLAGALLAASCAREDVQLVPHDLEPPAGPPSVVGAETTRARYCAGHGPPLHARSGRTCTDRPLAAIFQHALCTCGDAAFTAPLTADAFDSDDGPYAGPEDGGGLGIDGQLITTAAIDLSGRLSVAGTGLMTIPASPFRVAADAQINADLAVAALEVEFGADLWLNGGIVSAGAVTVAGDLHQTGSLGPTAGVTVAGRKLLTEDFTIAPPCPCGDAERLDLSALVAEGAQSRHNDEVGLARDALAMLLPGSRLELGCGRFAIDGGWIPAGSELTARGRSALLVDGDLIVTGSVGADLGADDELDVFVSGRLLLEPGAQLGNPERPAALRLYVGGSSEQAVLGALSVDAALYAPGMRWFVTAGQTFGGSLFVEAYHAVAEQVIHYDRAAGRLLASGAACAGPP